MLVTGEATTDYFFYEILTSALYDTGTSVDLHTEYYLVNILTHYTDTPVTEDPLALKILDFTSDRPLALKEAGDTALFVTGFVPEIIKNATVSESYYKAIGASAYNELANRSDFNSLSDVFSELSDEFNNLVDVLSSVRRKVAIF